MKSSNPSEEAEEETKETAVVKDLRAQIAILAAAEASRAKDHRLQ